MAFSSSLRTRETMRLKPSCIHNNRAQDGSGRVFVTIQNLPKVAEGCEQFGIFQTGSALKQLEYSTYGTETLPRFAAVWHGQCRAARIELRLRMVIPILDQDAVGVPLGVVKLTRPHRPVKRQKPDAAQKK